jgi:hypothetical protein
MRRIALLLALAGCVGTETGNPYEDDGTFGTDGPMGIAPQPILDSAVLGLEEVTLTGADPGETGCETTAAIFEGPRALDLVREGGEPLMWTLREGSWCEVGVFLAGEGEAPTFEATGSLLDGSTLEVRLDSAVEARLSTTEPFVLAEGEGLHLILDIERLFAEASLGTAPREGGVVRIDERSDPERAGAIGAAFAPALRVVRDTNGDGVLDPEERDGPVLATGAS